MTKTWMRVPFCFMSVAALALTSDASAQQTPPPPVCTAEEFRRFDFWAGEWVVTNAKGDTVGTSRITLVSRGCAVLEEWRDRSGGSGTSLNFWEPARAAGISCGSAAAARFCGSRGTTTTAQWS
ncbi:MAG: hypothetical protein NUW01_02155 [Gemmatimonadaceae bacterium]|nr:hypothetical protein [Gemmatimonadaceae bacterium]